MKQTHIGIIGGALLLGACATNTVPVSPAAPIVEAPAAPVFSQADFMGGTSSEVESLVGEANLVRQEGVGDYRRYGLKECVLIVIFAPDENDVSRVAHIDAAALKSGEEKPDLDECLGGGLS